MVEFAMVLPILCVILFAVVEFGQAYWSYQQLSAAASEGARKAAVSRTNPDRTAAVTSAVKNAAPSLKASDVDVSISSSWTPGQSVSVTAQYEDPITIMGVTLFAGDMSTTRTTRVEA
ncbi:MAG: hypothetical protein JWM90_2867 [Thermoleophilia bacterium]|nr:hypothetical protein [Thermoleophilia bacterium]